ncbi:site-specific integrase [Halomicroarcula sp. GCM10025817]|uniref:site-specific integrase n=1 Tax=Haloarcula TaxID=2237 RepID=UPI0023E82025|nr:site-specific integrase [Halomicroarcula sp. SYNS111]
MVRIDDSEHEVKVWLDYPDEVEQVEEKARSRDWEQEILVQLCARVGCRVSGALTAKPENLRWNSDGEYWEMELKGKNTKGGVKTVRDAYVPKEVKNNLDRYQSEREIDDSEPYVSKSVDTARRWIREITNELAQETGNERWQHVSSHDLRRSWANHHLVEESVNVRVMMEIGGWSSYQAIEPYLGKPTPSKIGSEMK